MGRKIASRYVVLPNRVVEATITTNDGKITEIADGIHPDAENFGDLVILPGIVDAHVHLNEPGRTDWEGFESGSKAAAAGGVTTVVDMPLNAIPPTTTVENFEAKIAAAEGKCWVDVAFWGGVIPGNAKDLVPLIKRGVRGFKCFLMDSGVEEFPAVSMEDVEKAMEELDGQPTVLMFHAELDTHHVQTPTTHPERYETYLKSRPDRFEVDAIEAVIKLARKLPAVPLHIVHLASAKALPMVENAQKGNLKLSAETCFHYLTLNSEDIPAKDTRYKCAPPIRTKTNQDELWQALHRGTIKTVVSDHSPCTPNLKLLDAGNFLEAWGGIASLGLGLTLLWSEAKERDISLADIAKWTSSNTASQCGLDNIKGSIEVGKDADFCIFDPNAKWTFEQSKMLFKNKLLPYDGRRVEGKVLETILRGNTVYQFGKSFGLATGALLLAERQ